MTPSAAPATTARSNAVAVRLIALVAACAVLLVVHYAGVLSSGVDDGAGGRLLGRLDAGAVVILAVAGYLLNRRPAQAHLSGAPAPPSVRPVVRFLGRAAPWWWLAVAFAVVVSPVALGPRRLLVSALFGRHPGSTGPLPGLSIGWVVSIVLVAVVLWPLWTRVVRRLPLRTALARELVGAGLLFACGLGWQLLAVVTDRTAAFGMRSLVPGHLDALAVGAALAALAQAGLLERRHQRLAVAAAAATFALMLVLVPGGVTGIGRGAMLLDHAGDLVLAAALVAAVATATNSRPSAPSRWLAVLAPGLVLFGESSLHLLARQHRERVVELDGVPFLVGPTLTLVLWSLLLAASIAAFGAWAIDRSVDRLLHGRVAPWRPASFAAAVAGVAGAGFTWRVIAWLTIAPERTDGGDPLFYHSAANLFAQGRGWPEPLNWIAYGRTIPSALHGPGYPLYLSITSRLGGTSYVDHKLASILAGSLLVVVVALVGRRVGGPRVGVVAAVLAAAYPNLWIIDGVLFPEGLFALLTTTGILLAYRWRDTHRSATALALGLSIGAAALVRGEGLFLVVLLAIPWLMLDRGIDLRTRLRHAVLAVVGTVAMAGPWLVYNIPRFEVLVPLSTNGNELHVYSNCDDTYSGKFLGFWLFECQERIRRVEGDPPGDEAERALAWREVGFDYARAHATELPKVVAARLGRQWELFRPFQNVEFAAIEGRNTTAAGWGLAMYYGLATAAIAGAVMLRRRRVALWPLGAQIVGVTITAAYAYGTTRFRAPAEPVLCILAAVALVPLGAAVARRLSPRQGVVPVGGEDAFVRGARGSTSRGRRRSAAALGALAVVVALPLRGLYRQPGSTMEEGFMLTFPERVLRGDVPNVDFLHLYGPGSLDVLAGVYQVFGVRLEVERTYGLVQHLAIILGVYTIVRAWGRGAAFAAAALSALLVLTPIGLSALAWNGAVALALWSTICALRAVAREPDDPAVSRRWWLGAGVLAGLALTYRPDLAVALVVALGYLLWRRRRAWAPVALGAAVGLLAMLVHLVRAGIGPSVEGMLLDPVFNLRPGRQLPRPPSFDHLDGALQVIGERIPPWWGLPHLPASQQLFWWFFLLPAVTAGVLAVAVWAHRRGDAVGRTRVLVAAALLATGLLPQALQRPDSAHFAWVGCLSFPLAVPAMIEVIARRRPSWHRLVRVGTAFAVVAATYLAVFPFYSYRTYLAHTRASLGLVDAGLEVRRGERSWLLGDERSWRATKAVVADLDELATPGERLLVGPVDLRQTAYSDVFFYYLFPELEPATYFIEMDPGLANAPGSRLTQDVASADWLILTRFWSGWIEDNDSIVFGPDDANVVVEEQFCLVRSYERDLVRLYQRCPGGGAPGPYEGPYDPTVDYAVEVAVPVPPRSDGTHPPGSPAAP
ncbi:MAG: glycosyltransferase family 39 protein [Actinomycetota bacterium]|nr:MAG: glycosyltransferase family 39 protein [Actinomycetota bacterium]